MTCQQRLRLICRPRTWGVLASAILASSLVAAPVIVSLPAAGQQAAPAAAAPSATEPVTEFYVDPDYTGAAHDGSAATPWADLGSSAGAPWGAINRALAEHDVVVYFSARGAERDENQVSTSGVNVARSDQSTHRVTLDGMSRHNADDVRPKWLPYDGPSRLEIRHAYPISAYIRGTNQDRITIRGFKAIGGYGGRGGQALTYWGGSHVLIENCEFMHDPAAKDGACVQFGYAWSEGGRRANGGCTDIVIRNNAIHDTFGEGIYIGGSGNTRDPETGKARPAHSRVLIEGNHVYNTGVRGAEGDCIDLKDGLSDVTVRNNICHDTRGGNATGISALSPFTAEGNVVHNTAGHGISFGTYWGSGLDGVVLRRNLVFHSGKSGVTMSSDRARPVTSVLVENNTLYGNRGAGLAVGVNPDGAITGLQVRYNVFSRNAPGIGGYGRADCTITGNDFHANQPDYAYPFRTSDDPTLAGRNLAFDPFFANAEDPAGPDGRFFTEDDGLLPKASAAAATEERPALGYLAIRSQSAVPPGAGTATAGPTAGAPQPAAARAVCTFESIGLYWTPAGGAEEKECRVQYRPAGKGTWHEALPLWFDRRNGEYRGSIVQLRGGTSYEVRLSLAGGPSTELLARTWSEEFPIARTVEVGDLTGQTLAVDQSGTPQGYVLYTHRRGAATATLDGANQVDNGVQVTASYVILRGLTVRAPKAHGIVLGNGAHDVVIEGCDISGWGRIHPDGYGVEMDSAIYSSYEPLERVVVQRCRIHDPRSNANSWQEFREAYNERYHPDGPQAICFIESEGNHVFRYNDVTTDDNHYCNDIFGGRANNSLRGFPGADSDVCGNRLEGCWDDGLEMEGGGCNVRIWGNFIDRTMVKIAIAGLSRGPIYIFRNVVGSGKLGPKSPGGGAFVKMGGPRPDGGRAYILHNTILQPVGAGGKRTGCDEGWAAGPLSIVSRNNILHVRGSTAIRGWQKDRNPEHDYDYDLLSDAGGAGATQEPHGVLGVPIYAPNRPEGDFSLDPSSPGYEAGVPVPNFSDGFRGKAPDMGAFEKGSPPMEFGAGAYLGRPPAAR